MTSKKTAQGVILHQVPFKDYDLILTVFTKELGLAKFIFSRGNSYKTRRGAAISPFFEGEFIYTERANGLNKCHEISPLHHHLELRQNFDCLKAASEVVLLLQRTQLELKPAPLLYDLTLLYLKKIADFPCLSNLKLSFLLKLIQHEGIFPFAEQCTSCSSPLLEIWLYKGESFCQRHAKQASSLQVSELQLLKEITACRSFQKLRLLPPLETIYDKLLKGLF